jgi:hypothetical protein
LESAHNDTRCHGVVEGMVNRHPSRRSRTTRRSAQLIERTGVPELGHDTGLLEEQDEIWRCGGQDISVVQPHGGSLHEVEHVDL